MDRFRFFLDNDPLQECSLYIVDFYIVRFVIAWEKQGKSMIVLETVGLIESNSESEMGINIGEREKERDQERK